MPGIADVIPRNVAAERVRRHWRQKDLAALLGWPHTRVSEVETRRREVQVDELVPLCAALSIPLLKLCDGADPDELHALGLT